MYAFPPPPLIVISKTLAKIEEAGITTLIIAPRWTPTPWWDSLVSMATGEMIELGLLRMGMALPRLGTLVATIERGGGIGNPFYKQPFRKRKTATL